MTASPDPSAEVRLRAARTEDVDELVALFNVLDRMQLPWRVFEPRPDPAAEAAQRFRSAIADPLARLVVAEAGDAILGMGLGRIARVSTSSDEPALDVTDVVVVPSRRGGGIGRAIARDLARFARDRGVRLVTLRVFSGNEGAVAFWSALGFRPRFVQMVAEAAEVR